MNTIIQFFSNRSKTFFKIFSTTHIVTLIIIAISIALLLLIISRYDEKVKKVFRIFFAYFALFLQFSYMFWLILNNNFTLKESLPLNICSVSLILTFFLLITKSKMIFCILYFWGLIGSLYALIFPQILHNFPHFRFFEFFLAHGTILLCVFYFLFIEKYSVSFKETVISYFLTVIYLLFVYIINLILNSNYLFLIKKPYFSSFFDLFAMNYRLTLLIVLLILFLILYLPFYIGKVIKKVECNTYLNNIK